MVFVLDLFCCRWENVTEFQDKLLSLLIFYTDCYMSLSNPHLHTCQVLGKSKSEIARAPLIFAYNLVIERAEKSEAQVLRVRFFSLFKQT